LYLPIGWWARILLFVYGRILETLNKQPNLICATHKLDTLSDECTARQNGNARKPCLGGARNGGGSNCWKVDAHLLAGLGPLDEDAPPLPGLLRSPHQHPVRPFSPFDCDDAAAVNDHCLPYIIRPQRTYNGKAKRDILLLRSVRLNSTERSFTYEQLRRHTGRRHDRKTFLFEEAHNARQNAVVTTRCNNAKNCWEITYEPEIWPQRRKIWAAHGPYNDEIRTPRPL
jgi:hypothetical protein